MSQAEILNAFAGSFSIPLMAAAPLLYEQKDERYHLAYPAAGNVAHYWIDPETDLVTKYTVLDTAGQVLVEADGDRTIEKDGITIPRLITVSFPADKRRVSIFYSSIVLNPTEMSFACEVPAGARKSSLRK